MPAAVVEPFAEILRDIPGYLRSLTGRSKPIIGYFCTHTPIELIHAAGFLPLRIFGGTGEVDLAYTLAPSFVCPPMLRSLEAALGGAYDSLAGVVQGYTCDVACGMVNIWQEAFPGIMCHTLPLPYNDCVEGRDFLRAALMELIAKIERLGGHLTSEGLARSLDVYAAIRHSLLDLYRMRYADLLPLAADDFYDIIHAAFIVAPEEYLTMLHELKGSLEEVSPPSTEGVPVLVAGSIIEDSSVFRILESVGARVVADDLCTGFRPFHTPEGEGPEPIERLMDRYLRRLPCPSRCRAEERLPMILELIRFSKAQGVVFLPQKFCTPHLADEPVLRRALAQEGIRSLVVELEATGIHAGQLTTRLQSFVEMLKES